MTTAREKHRARLLEYLSDPEQDYPDRGTYQKHLGIAGKTLYYHFTPADLTAEAYEIRKKNSARPRAAVLKALLASAKKGSVQAAREYLDRTEGRVMERKQIEQVAPQILQDNINALTESEAEEIYKNVLG